MKILKFKERLKQERELSGLSQKQLADKFGVSQNSVSRWELGVREPDYQTLIMLAEIFGVSSDYLLGIEN